MNKPELLLPVGNVENFHAAIKGGADAIYLGLRKFNARGRASNFTNSQFVSIIEEADSNNVKVYITLNTVIKNNELPELLDTIWFLSKTKVSAVIIQDWGVYHILKNHFPKLVVHASTQMGNHNSIGATHCKQLGFERVILARELTIQELETISNKSEIELETFSHGALCYSFSGMCLYSSFLGGHGANRGLCAQPCRRDFKDNNKNKFLFSLKDNQQIENIPQLMDFGISSIKIEGRMKSAEYVYNVARAYKMAIDNFRDISEAKKILKYDFGRDKTSYFMGGNVSKAITENPNTGNFIGKVIKSNSTSILIESNHQLEVGNRIRVINKRDNSQENIKIKKITNTGNGIYKIDCEDKPASKNDKVFLIGLSEVKFSNKLEKIVKTPEDVMPQHIKGKILKSYKHSSSTSKPQLFVRIDELKWLRKIWFDSIDALVLNLSISEWKEFDATAPFINKNIKKIHVELPKFISEQKLEFYKSLCIDLHKKGVQNFVISHLSQKLLVPKTASIITNENVYVFNDAAATLLKENQVTLFSYPQENDFENLLLSKDRTGIVPIYFKPELFYSRMPVKVENIEQTFIDDIGNTFNKNVRDGITIVTPEHPVSLLQHKNKLDKAGFSNYLIDLSDVSISKNTFKNLISKYQRSEQIQPSTIFNAKGGLK